ncbi:hypothetical protein [Williamsia sp. CHRR-6]|uniref:hypothetical protein n=1 Tax=Williamsia sp. CHRR-6 TaxID=2835871 RepID=UPI001BD9FEFD|nr:hypothetical protein [Williamsia sp. CHRR-6]MBT0565610.1 hypothetical protein [Williamsia sp. CHRR-6]
MSTSTEPTRTTSSTWPLAVLLTSVLLLAGCFAAPQDSAAPPSSGARTTGSGAPPSSDHSTPSTGASTTLVDPTAAGTSSVPARVAASFRTLDAGLDAEVAVVVVSGSRTLTFGVPMTGPAWSTIKAPLAIAAIGHGGGAVSGLVRRALTASDNAAAEDLWTSLGTPTQAAAAVTAVLAQSGDTTTSVQSARIRTGFTAFGQTRWPLAAQARFARQLPCITGSASVIAAMREIEPGQQWGLAGTGTVAAKGGWGPDPDGKYLVRQIALVSDAAGTFGVALAARPRDGSFSSGTATLSALAQWVLANRAAFDGPTCQRSAAASSHRDTLHAQTPATSAIGTTP